jgi:hypothetical protein
VNVYDHDSVAAIGFFGSKSGYVVCVGWTFDAGQKGAPVLFLNVTVSPSLITNFDGLNPLSRSVTVDAFLALVKNILKTTTQTKHTKKRPVKKSTAFFDGSG